MKQKSLLITGLLVILALILFSLIGCEPVRVVETITTDSTGKSIKTKTKYYQQTNGYSVQPDIHVIATPLFYNRVPVYVPVYRTPITRGYSSYGFRHRH
jgi:hypothetical protein